MQNVLDHVLIVAEEDVLTAVVEDVAHNVNCIALLGALEPVKVIVH